MNPLKSGAASLIVVIGATAAHAQTDTQPMHLEIMDTCKNSLIVWLPLRQEPKCGQVQTPQVKIFDGNGRLRYVGTGMATLQWAKSGMPSTPIPADVAVRDAVSEARLTHASAPVSGHGWITYYTTKPCPPCIEQLATLRSDVLPKLGVKTEITVFDMY